jgi:flagellin-like protein
MTHDRGVSPVVGVAILIGVVVALAVTVGVFTTDLVGSQTNASVGDQPDATPTPTDAGREPRPDRTGERSTHDTRQVMYLCGTSSRADRRRARRGQLPANATGPVLPGSYATAVYLTNTGNDTATVSVSIRGNNRARHLEPAGTVHLNCRDLAALNRSEGRVQTGALTVTANDTLQVTVVTTVGARGGTTVTKRHFTTRQN